MQRRKFTSALGLGLGLAAPAWALPSSEGDAAAGVRSALERGAVAAVRVLGRPDGFLGNPKVRIPLPRALDQAAALLRAAGQQQRVDALVTAMNRAAETAVPEAQALLVNAVKSISIEDARRLVTGGNGAVTRFFEDKTRAPLGERFLPIVTRATARVDLAQRYNAVAGQAAAFGLLRAEDANVEQYVTTKALDGLFLMIGEEERRIRRDPVGTGSEILRRVFGR